MKLFKSITYVVAESSEDVPKLIQRLGDRGSFFVAQATAAMVESDGVIDTLPIDNLSESDLTIRKLIETVPGILADKEDPEYR